MTMEIKKQWAEDIRGRLEIAGEKLQNAVEFVKSCRAEQNVKESAIKELLFVRKTLLEKTEREDDYLIDYYAFFKKDYRKLFAVCLSKRAFTALEKAGEL
ncbi:hypothetical protein [Cetobacterium sp.]|uniref:hypothetical protein n=1 Tax=Cetobacterium sp. TaxID=2071632 RepID=UPI003F3BE544